MEEQEVRNFLLSEGDKTTATAVPTIAVSENVLVDISDEIESEGLDSVIKHFGTIANAFKTENGYSCSPDVLCEAVKVIRTALVRLHMEITACQGDVKGSLVNVDRQTRHKFRKYMAVLFFLVYKSFTEIERNITNEAQSLSFQYAAKESSRRRKKQEDEEDQTESQYKFWNHWRANIISDVEKVVNPPMDEIWQGMHDGVNFMRCLTLSFCTIIKNKSRRLRATDHETNDIFDILGVLASRHQEEKSIMSRLIPNLKGSEETAGIIGAGVHRMILKATPDQAENVVLHAMTEALDVYTSSMQKETAADRGFSTFLIELCNLEPKGALRSLPVLVQFLEADSQIVRNGVLVVASNLMKWTWDMMAEEESQENDDGMETHRRENWLKIRKKLMDEILLHHMRDTNSLVRSKATTLLTTEIVGRQQVRPGEAVEIMKNVKLRLLDKTVTARKAATTLVIELVKLYPHMVSPAEDFERKLGEKREEIVRIIQRDESDPAVALYFIIKEFHLHLSMDAFAVSSAVSEKTADLEEAMAFIETQLKEGRYWQACEAFQLCLQKYNQVSQLLDTVRRNEEETNEQLFLNYFKVTYPGIFSQNLNSLDLSERNYIAPSAVQANRNFIIYLQCCYRMKCELDKCQPSLRKLLELGTTTDKKEAVLFYATICEAGYKTPKAVTVAIINALAQLNPEELKDFVQPFKKIFIGRENENIGPAGFVRKLIHLVHELSESSDAGLSAMIGELYRNRELTRECVQVLWDAYSLSTGNWQPQESRCAASILGVIGQIERKIITTNLDQLIDIGLGVRGLEDFELAKITLRAILFGCKVEQEFVEPEVPKSGRSKGAVKVAQTKRPADGIKFQPEHKLFVNIVKIIETGLKIEGDDKLDTMYSRVVELAMQIIYRMCTQPSEVVSSFLPNIHGLVFGIAESQEVLEGFKTSEKLLLRYMGFGKALLGAHINYYEQIVSKEIKSRKAATDKVKKKNKVSSRQRTFRESSNSSTSTTSMMMNQSNQDSVSEMDLMIGNIGFDSEQDHIKTYISKLLDNGFFRQFRTHVLYLCQLFHSIKSLSLKVACIQALAKLMLVCEASVTKSIDILIKLWSGDEHFAVKLEILRASIRLTVRFPNQMEKLNDCFSAGLASKDKRVRKACMDYIQYLALSDLLKVREQLSDTAACLCDEDYDLREMARDFIKEISEKDNTLQNSIPDIISRLSSREDIPQENFQSIMKTLLTKVKKEKQLGGLVERIVGRFKGTVPVRVCQDTAFCLTQIQQNDKTLKILKDNFACYADKLGDEFVWESFGEILSAIKKLNKPELKTKIEEWEKDLEEHRSKCVTTLAAENEKRKQTNKQRQKLVESGSESDDEVMDDEGEADEGEDGNSSEVVADDKEDDENTDEDIADDKEDDNTDDEKMENSD